MTARDATSAAGALQRRPLVRLWRLADPDLPRLLLALLFATLSLVSGVGLLAVSAWLISRAAEQPPILFLQVAIVAVRAFGIGRGVFRYAERLAGHDAALRSLTHIRIGVYQRLERLAPAGLGRYRHGDLLARLVGDVDTSVDLIVRVVLPAVSGLLAAGLAVTIGMVLLPAGGMALLAMVALVGLVVPWLAGRLGTRAQSRRAAAEGRLTEQVVASLTASSELLAYGAVEATVTGIGATDAELTEIDRRSAGATGAAAALSVLATGSTVVLVLVLGSAALAEGSVSSVWLATLVLLPLAIADVLSAMPGAALARARVAGAAHRIFEVIDAPDPVPAAEARTPADIRVQRSARDGGPGTIVLDGMCARYPGAARPAVAGIDLGLTPGRRVAVVGPSGSGKSTVAAVLLRLLDFDGGRYTLDGRSARDLPEDLVRESVTLMDQRGHLFDTTIEQNLLLANRSAGPEEVRAAVCAAQLDTWIDSLPEGLATRVGRHATAVSGGQAQRIALARVLLADRPSVVLDEPGEHLDPVMADAVTATAMRATGGRSVLLITHRMAHTGLCDEVLVLADGHVVERGAPEHLRSGSGWYAASVAREDSRIPKELPDE